MSKRILFSFLNRMTQLVLWVCLSILILAPTSNLYAQDPDDVDDIEEFWGDDEEYEDDEYEDDEYLDDEEYEDDEEYDDEEYEEYDDEEYEEYDDEEYEDDETDDTELADEADILGYTIDLAGGSPRFVNMNLQDWGSSVDLRASIEFPILMQVLGMRFRFGAEVGTFKFQHDMPPKTDTYNGVTAMGLISFPAGPGKIKFGAGIVGASPAFMMEASYGFKVGGILDIRGGIRSTEVMEGKTTEELLLGRTGWMDGVLVLGINF